MADDSQSSKLSATLPSRSAFSTGTGVSEEEERPSLRCLLRARLSLLGRLIGDTSLSSSGKESSFSSFLVPRGGLVRPLRPAFAVWKICTSGAL